MINLHNNKDLSKIVKKLHGHIQAPFCVAAGEKCKIIGIQDGTFPEFGHHVKDEMGGVWVHPIKLMDSFFSKVNNEQIIADKYQSLPYGNLFTYTKSNVEIERFQFSPDEVKGFILDYKFTNKTDKEKSFDFETVFKFHLSPVWFSENIGINSGETTASFYKDVVVAKDSANPWFCVVDSSFGLNLSNTDFYEKETNDISFNHGYYGAVKSKIILAPNKSLTISFYIAGSHTDKDEAISECKKLKENHNAYLQNKLNRYKKIKDTANLSTSDIVFDKQYEWVKYNNDWLIQQSDEFGRAPMAGIPEYTWWFGCDNSYTIQGLLALGDFELVKSTLELLHDVSKKANGNGRIIHEVNTFGAVSNLGNTQETAHYITAVYKYLCYTGDTDTVKKLYPYCAQGIQWLMDMDDDKDLLPSGYGIIEIEGLNVELIDTAVYTCQALYNMHDMSVIFGEEGKDYLEKATKLKEIINTKLWNDEENLYVDAMGKAKQILERIPLIKEQLQRDGKVLEPKYEDYLNKQEAKFKKLDPEAETPFILNKNWVINTPMETMISEHDKAIKALDTMKSEDFVGEYGVHLAGFAKDATMTISTGVQAVSEGRYKRSDNALALLEKMMNTMGKVMPGAINEMSPDYGCFVQAWTIYSLMVPIVECFIGLNPDIANKKITLDPCIPIKWDRLNMSNIRVGQDNIDFSFARCGSKETYIISSSQDYSIEFILPSCKKATINGIICEGTINIKKGTNVIEIIK